MPTITITPDPPSQGDNATVKITGVSYPCTLTLTWTPAGAGPATIEITSASGNVLTIPPNATTLKITGGGANALVVVISP